MFFLLTHRENGKWFQQDVRTLWKLFPKDIYRYDVAYIVTRNSTALMQVLNGRISQSAVEPQCYDYAVGCDNPQVCFL